MADSLWNPALGAMGAYAVPAAEGLVKLDAMENPYGLPAPVLKAFIERLPALAVNRYPDAGGTALKAALGRAFPVDAAFASVLGNGSDELIAMLMQSVLQPGACVLAPEPGFVMYRRCAELLGLRYVGVPLREDFGLDMAAMLAAIDREQPQLVFVASPNNPTGNAFAAAELAELARATPGLFVLDEAYIPYAEGDGADFAAGEDNVVLLRTLSKWGLAGLRLGFVQARKPVCEALEKLRMPYNVNALSQELGRICLEQAGAFAPQIDTLKTERARLAQALAAPGVEVYPSQANFLLVRVPDAVAANARLREAGLLLKCLHGTHPLLRQCLRISVGRPEENEALLAAWPGAL